VIEYGLFIYAPIFYQGGSEMDADKMQELFDVYKDLIDEQTKYAIDLASKLEFFGNELNIILLLDALACTGLQLVPITEENIPSLAVLRYSVAFAHQ